MNCQKCGEALTPEDRFCTNCGAQVTGTVPVTTPIQQLQPQPDPGPQPLQVQAAPVNPQHNVVVSSGNAQTVIVEDNKMANNLCIISLLLRFVGPIICSAIAALLSTVSEELGSLFALISPLCSVASFVLVIYAVIKYPTSKFAKILLWVYIGLFIASVILIIVVVIACLGLVSQY